MRQRRMSLASDLLRVFACAFFPPALPAAALQWPVANLMAPFWGPPQPGSLQQRVTFVLFVAFLLVRPTGLFGRRGT
jgi:branched-subunit amino acid ABC-type transport system permease component